METRSSMHVGELWTSHGLRRKLHVLNKAESADSGKPPRMFPFAKKEKNVVLTLQADGI
jgi:hypothetical protein